MKKEPKQEEYLLWGDDNTTGEEQGKGKGPPPIQAPKLTLPGHNASYNPPKEYLPTEEEKKNGKKWIQKIVQIISYHVDMIQ